MTFGRNAAIDKLWGCGDLEACFNGAITTGAPWARAGRLKTEPAVPPEGVDELVAAPARLIEVDPRTLFASQPSVVRTHARYYLTGRWEITGRTSADMDKLGNRYPTFAERRGQLVILTGHHRSLAALIEGRPVLARVVGADAEAPVALTPHLRIADTGQLVGVNELDDLIRRLTSGEPVTVSSPASAAAVLRRVGLETAEIEDRLRHAGFDPSPAGGG